MRIHFKWAYKLHNSANVNKGQALLKCPLNGSNRIAENRHVRPSLSRAAKTTHFRRNVFDQPPSTGHLIKSTHVANKSKPPKRDGKIMFLTLINIKFSATLRPQNCLHEIYERQRTAWNAACSSCVSPSVFARNMLHITNDYEIGRQYLSDCRTAIKIPKLSEAKLLRPQKIGGFFFVFASFHGANERMWKMCV